MESSINQVLWEPENQFTNPIQHLAVVLTTDSKDADQGLGRAFNCPTWYWLALFFLMGYLPILNMRRSFKSWKIQEHGACIPTRQLRWELNDGCSLKASVCELGKILPFRGYLVTSGDIFLVTDQRRVLLASCGWRPGDAGKHPTAHRPDSGTKDVTFSECP